MERVPLNIWLLFYRSDKTDLFSTDHIKYYFLSACSTVPLKVKKYTKGSIGSSIFLLLVVKSFPKEKLKY